MDKNIEVEMYDDEYDGWCVTFYQQKNINKEKSPKMPIW
jgi:hypothetical protein